jgi:hypothetical protein
VRAPFAVLVFGCFLSSLLASPAAGRVNPLLAIKRQIHQPNILIVLDTSGSLTGVPGGTFDNTKEVGVDCDDGANCRQGSRSGTCSISKKTCSQDTDCQTFSCALDGQPCVDSTDCRPTPGTCNQQKCTAAGCVPVLCATDNDCTGLTSGSCSATGVSCDATHPCASQPKCVVTGAKCALGSSCGTYGQCLDAGGTLTSTFCRTSTDCPLLPTGTCAVGLATCTKNADCLVKLCPDGQTSCLSDADCAVCSSGNSTQGTFCSSAADCTTSGATCRAAAGSCSAGNNRCVLPNAPCSVAGTEACRETNSCLAPTASCIAGTPNSCVSGNPNDVCGAGTTAGYIGMCRLSLNICSTNSDCRGTGDSCGPPTSRTVIAKRVLSQVVGEDSGIANFGLMTFYQSGYFPYYKRTNGTPSTQTTVISHGRLQSNGCYDKKTGPTSTCTIGGVTYTIDSSHVASYKIEGSGHQTADSIYCGYFCNVGGKTGILDGVYYNYTVLTGGTVSNTLTVFPSYTGKDIVSGTTSYHYYDSNPAYYNGGPAPPISVPNCWNTCSASCGGRWDTQLAPFLDPSGNPSAAQSMANAIYADMQPASYGGLISYGGTPTGCTLLNTGAADEKHSAYHYMQKVKSIDTLSCRDNYVLLITDGEANGPGDNYCDSSACAAADPVGAGCRCNAVLSAYKMRKDLGVKTLVVGFSSDVTSGPGKATNDNIAKAGGTDAGDDGAAPYAYAATSEDQLLSAIQSAIYQAVKGSYATSPPTVSTALSPSGSSTTVQYALDSRVDFPSWKGHLLAYDTSVSPPTLVWDAATQMANTDWKTRKVFTSDVAGRMVPVQIQSDGSIANKSVLYALGLGATADEAEKIARWSLGDPALGNPAVLGAFVNSTPIDIGPPGSGTMPGFQAFSSLYQNRPHLTYVASDDGMLHAFYTMDQLVGGSLKRGGSEAFAYLPPEMLPVLTKVYAQGGQIADPAGHIFTLASSAKAKNICLGGCTSAATAVWRTVLFMTDGFGGNNTFALDITNPTGAVPLQLLWSTDLSSSSAAYNVELGETISVPALYFTNDTPMQDYRILMGSGYRMDATSATATQGKWIVSATARDGTIIRDAQVPVSGSCTQDYALLTDVGVAKDFTRDVTQNIDAHGKLLAGYVGDTWGNVWRYTDVASPAVSLALGCQQPLHFTPTVVQLDRDNPNNHPKEIYLVAVTNSPLDDDTFGFPASKLVIAKEKGDASNRITTDTSFGSSGKVTLTAGSSPQLCAVSNAAGTSCVTPLPANARPLATPTAVLKADGTGFVVMSSWYVPASQGCGKGTTYLVLNQVDSTGNVTLKQALKVGDEPVSAPLMGNGQMFVMSSSGPVSIQGLLLQKITPGTAGTNGKGTGLPFNVLGWTEAF